MESELLQIINKEMSDYNYEYGEYTGTLVYPYIVGEYNESAFNYEDNVVNGEFILTLFHRGSELDLINIKEEIKNKFADYRATINNSVVYVSYRNKMFVRSGEAELKRMEIYLDTKIMKGE